MIQLTKSRVVFNEQDHTYTLDGKKLHGITSTLIRRAFPQKYADVPDEVLARAAERGHSIHKQIEMADREDEMPTCPEAVNYSFLKDRYGLETEANEYLVSDNERYASSIDVVFTNGLGEICLADIKTTYKLYTDSVALQLSIYRRFFEKQNALHVDHLYGLWLRGEKAELVEVSPVDDDTLDALFKADIEDRPFDYNPVPDWYSPLEIRYREETEIIAMAEARRDDVKKMIMEHMKSANMSQIKSGDFTVSYIPEKVSRRFDSTAFKKDNADLYSFYMKDGKAAEQIRFLPTRK